MVAKVYFESLKKELNGDIYLFVVLGNLILVKDSLGYNSSSFNIFWDSNPPLFILTYWSLEVIREIKLPSSAIIMIMKILSIKLWSLVVH